jgi:hypothetical protein
LELRQRLTTDEDQQTSGTAGSPQGSTASSIDGVYLSNRTSIQSAPSTSHPFKYIEQDALSLHSLSSIGRGGLLLSQLRPDPGNILCIYYFSRGLRKYGLREDHT